ncbi:MAG TPA: arsenate reductase ArsC [Tepidisphaeraceae bacterium]|jgi:arsenate reductase|nr:arsenate reductase ArsC [Tepidisphaeraceae bacterium]
MDALPPDAGKEKVHSKILECLICCLGEVAELKAEANILDGTAPIRGRAATDFFAIVNSLKRIQMEGETAMSDEKPNVLFLCTGNSCRSQMAEGFARRLLADQINAFSAGVEPHGMNPRAMKVMSEAGVDISQQHSKHLDELKDVSFSHVVTVCGQAHEACPLFPGKTQVIHVGFDDPPRLAKDAKTEEEALGHYRRVRDEIRGFIERLGDYIPLHNRA